MNDLDHAAQLLFSAERDIRAIKAMLNAESFSDEIFGFHVQQAIEKLLKTWIAALGVEYPLTHNIGRLLQVLESKGLDINIFADAIEYTAYAVEFRYGAVDLSDDPVDRIEAIRRVTELYEHVVDILDSKREP